MADDPNVSLPKPPAHDQCLVARSGWVETFWYDRLIELVLPDVPLLVPPPLPLPLPLPLEGS